MTTNSCYYSTNTDPLVNRRVAKVVFLMEAFECTEGASSVGRAADEGGVELLSPVHTQLTIESNSPRDEKRTAAATYTLVHSKRLQW